MKLNKNTLTIFYFEAKSEAEIKWLKENSGKLIVRENEQKEYVVSPKNFKDFLASPVLKELEIYTKIK